MLMCEMFSAGDDPVGVDLDHDCAPSNHSSVHRDKSSHPSSSSTSAGISDS